MQRPMILFNVLVMCVFCSCFCVLLVCCHCILDIGVDLGSIASWDQLNCNICRYFSTSNFNLHSAAITEVLHTEIHIS